MTLYYANCAPPGREPHWGSVKRSKAFGGDGFYYGDRVKGCSTSGQYRPSGENMMCGTGGCIKSNSYAGGSSEFDVVSCGYLRTAIEHNTAYLRAIPKDELVANWEACKKMKGIVQPLIFTGKEIDQLSNTEESASRLFAALFPALAQANPDLGGTVNLDFNSPYIAVEEFAKDGSISAEIFERVGEDKGEETIWRKVETSESSTEATATDGASGGGLNWVPAILEDSAGGSAAEIARRYCPDPAKDFFKGSIYHEGRAPWIEVVVDPEFEKKMVAERHLTAPLPLTPIYDLVVRIKPEFNHYCIPGWLGEDGKPGRDVKASDLPKTLPIQGFITIGEGANLEKLVGPGAFSLTDKQDEQKRFIYEWKLKGWPNGIAPNEKLEKLIDAIASGKGFAIALDITRKSGANERETGGGNMSLCAQLSGGNPHAVISMRGKSAQSSLTAAGLVQLAEAIREQGFEEIQPFKRYSKPYLNKAGKSYFAHFVDLAAPDDTRWKMLFGFFVGANSTPKKISSCGSNGSQYFFFTDRLAKQIYAPYGNKVVFMHAHESEGARVEISELMYMHEMAHSFAGLEDEYHTGFDITLYYANCALASLRPKFRNTQGDALSKKLALASRDTDLTEFFQAYWDQ